MPVRKGCLRPTLPLASPREHIQRWPVLAALSGEFEQAASKPRQDWLAEFWNRAGCWPGSSGSPRRVEGADLGHDRRDVVGGPLLADLAVGDPVDVHRVPPDRLAVGRRPSRLPLTLAVTTSRTTTRSFSAVMSCSA